MRPAPIRTERWTVIIRCPHGVQHSAPVYMLGAGEVVDGCPQAIADREWAAFLKSVTPTRRKRLRLWFTKGRQT